MFLLLKIGNYSEPETYYGNPIQFLKETKLHGPSTPHYPIISFHTHSFQLL